MAENKKGFLLYADLIHTVEKMPVEMAGELFITILQYVNDQNPKPKDLTIELVFEGIKHQLKRDLRKYEQRAERSRNNGKLGGRPKTQKNPEKPTGLNKNPDEPRKPDTDNDTDNDTVSNKSYLDGLLLKFKNQYPKGVNPMVILPILQSLPKEEQQRAVDYVPIYLKNKPKDLAVMKPANYLSSYCWNDKQLDLEPKRKIKYLDE